MNPALDLLDEAVSTLRGQLATQAKGEARYLALLSANAVAIARREIEVAGRLNEEPVSIADIRAGRHDGDNELYARLFARTGLKAWIADPENLSLSERESLDLR